MTDDLMDTALTVAEWLLLPVALVVWAGASAWRRLRRAPCAKRGPELAALADDNAPVVIDAADLFLAHKAQEDRR